MPVRCWVSWFFALYVYGLEGGPGHREEKAGEPGLFAGAGAVA